MFTFFSLFVIFTFSGHFYNLKKLNLRQPVCENHLWNPSGMNYERTKHEKKNFQKFETLPSSLENKNKFV